MPGIAAVKQWRRLRTRSPGDAVVSRRASVWEAEVSRVRIRREGECGSVDNVPARTQRSGDTADR